jgi:hypothetical protein
VPGNRADRRNHREPAADFALGFFRHEKAAVGAAAGRDRERLAFELLQARGFAVAYIGVEGRTMFEFGAGNGARIATKRGAARLEYEFVEHALIGVERIADARDLVAGQRIAGLFLDLLQTLVVLLLERLQQAHEFVEGRYQVGGLGFGGCGDVFHRIPLPGGVLD